MKTSKIRKRSAIVGGRKTSFSLEDVFWDEFRRIVQQRMATIAEVVDEVDRQRGDHNLSSAVRLFVLSEVQKKAELERAASAGALPPPVPGKEREWDVGGM